MTPRALARLLGGVALIALLLFVASCSYFSLGGVAPDKRVRIVSTWRAGELGTRKVLAPGEAVPTDALPAGVTRVVEEGVAEAPLARTPGLFELGIVPGRDGVVATLDGKTAYVTVDDLLVARGYDHTAAFAEAGLGVGADRELILGLLSKSLDAPANEVNDRADFKRVRFERTIAPSSGARPPTPSEISAPSASLPGASAWGSAPDTPATSTPSLDLIPQPPTPTASTLTPSLVHSGVREAAGYLVRNLDENGRFRYLVDAPTDKSLAGYSWPRHAGATFFLAQAAGVEHDPDFTWAALRAAGIMRAEMMQDCGAHKCITEDPIAEIGSSALGLLALVEIVRRDLDASYLPAIRELTEFLRSQQREDGEFMHQYDRTAKKPLDIQLLYFSGEATLALARAHRVTHDPRDLEAAKRGLARLVGSGWHFFGDRYYFSEEHWTCQALDDLWERAPNEDALAFCNLWHEYQRHLQYGPGESGMDAEGAFGVGSFVSPRLTPASSRGEAAGATLSAVEKRERERGSSDPNHALLSRELDGAVAFVLRHQWRPGPTHLFRNPEHVRGAMPGSPVDWQIRIDYLQHAGSMLVRWLELNETRATPGALTTPNAVPSTPN